METPIVTRVFRKLVVESPGPGYGFVFSYIVDDVFVEVASQLEEDFK